MSINCTPDDDFKIFAERYWNWRLEDVPELASSIDVHTYDDRVEQYSIDILDKRKVEIYSFLLFKPYPANTETGQPLPPV